MKQMCLFLSVLLLAESSLFPRSGKRRISPEQRRKYPQLGSLYQGDILLPIESSSIRENKGKNALSIPHLLWPEGIVPYVFHSNYTEDDREFVLKAMSVIENGTCVQFVPREDQADYVQFRMVFGDGCFAMVGRHAGRSEPQPVNLEKPGCFRKLGAAEHELLHVLGLLHEQSRPDRGLYVEVRWNNIEREFWPDFYRARPDQVSTYGVPYGYKSLMHYPRDAFSKNGKPTIVNKDHPEMVLGQYEGPADDDLLKVRRMYNCSDT